MPSSVNCRFFYEDYHRGREVKECRLPKNRASEPWNLAVCNSCPVPGILHRSNTPYLAIEGTIKRKLLRGDRMEVFAICTKHKQHLSDPSTCPNCAAESA